MLLRVVCERAAFRVRVLGVQFWRDGVVYDCFSEASVHSGFEDTPIFDISEELFSPEGARVGGFLWLRDLPSTWAFALWRLQAQQRRCRKRADLLFSELRRAP